MNAYGLPLTLSVAEVMEHLRCKRSQVYRLMATGELRYRQVGRRRKVLTSSLLAYLGEDPQGA